MNNKKAEQILETFGTSIVTVGDSVIKFARQTHHDIKQIESKTDEELVNSWKSLVWLNEIYGQVSVNDLQRITLIELEMLERNISFEPLNDWYKKESERFDEQNFNEYEVENETDI